MPKNNPQSRERTTYAVNSEIFKKVYDLALSGPDNHR